MLLSARESNRLRTFWPQPVSVFGWFGLTMRVNGSRKLGMSSSLTLPTTLTLVVAETSSRLSPNPKARRIVSAASDPTVTSRAGADRLLRTEPQVHVMEIPC